MAARARAPPRAPCPRRPCVRSQRSAPPHSISCAPGSSSGGACEGSDRRHSGASPAKNGSVCSRMPDQKRSACAASTTLAADSLRRRRAPRSARPTGARRSSPSCQALAETGSGCPAQRLSALERLVLAAARARSVSSCGGRGSTLSETSRISAERAERAGEQARHVVAGDVLHHLAAEGEHRARGRRAAARRARSRAPRRRSRGAGPRGPPRRSRRASRRRRNAAARTAASGRCPASVASSSASGVPQRAVTTSSVGS